MTSFSTLSSSTSFDFSFTNFNLGLVLTCDAVRHGLERAWCDSDRIRITLATSRWQVMLPMMQQSTIDAIICDHDGTNASTENLCRVAEMNRELRLIVLATTYDQQAHERFVAAGVGAFLSLASRAKHLENALDWVSAGRFVADRPDQFMAPRESQSNPRSNRPKNISRIEDGSHAVPSSANFSKAPSPSSSARLLQSLSNRECEVLEGLIDGKTNQQIADHLFLSVKTIETYRHRIRKKLGVVDRAAMVRLTRQCQPAVAAAKLR